MKKFYFVLLTFMLAFCVIGCDKKTESPSQQTQAQAQKPTISGAKDVTIHVGDKFRPMDGITAKDADGNEISANDISYSGNVDVKTPGVYQATYTVSDKNGVTNSVTITVTVIALDEEAPLLTGVGNVDVVVTQPFDKMAGVSANDTVDGNLTSAIVATGDVDYKHIGTYKVEYKVSDKTGNESVKTRTVNVTVGAFKFDAETKAQTLEVSATLDPKSKYSYGLVQVNYTAEAEATVKVKLGSYEVETKHAAAGTYAQYVPYSSALDKAQLEVTGATFVSYIVGDAADVIAPTFTGDFTKTVAISKDHKDAAVQFIIDMCGAKAKDDRDGFITDKITANFEGINWDSKEEQTLSLEVLDLAGNKGTQQVKVVVNAETELADFMESLEAIAQDGNTDNAQYSDYYRNATPVAATDDDKGSVKIDKVSSYGYWSYSMVRFVLTDLVTEGNYYVLKITARAGLEESQGQLTQGISYRIGGALNADPWYYEFEGCSVGGSTYGENRMELTSEYKTIYRIFKADFRSEAANIEDCYGIKMEFQLSPQDYSTVYPVYVKEFSISLLSNEDQAPVLKQDTSKPTVLVVGDAIDLSSYFTATDIEDGDLQVNVEGTVDTTKKGIYPVKFSTVDSKGHAVETTINFEVLTVKDESKPVIELTVELADDYLINELTNEQVQALLPTILKITDTKNGESYDIPVSEAKINYGTLDMSKAGKYKITVTAKDSSGNEGTLEISVKVVKERVQPTSGTKDELVMDLTPTAVPSGEGGIHSIENATVVVNEGVAEILPSTFENGGWASFNKLKYTLTGKFEVGHKYALIIEAKADQARDIKVNLGGNYWPNNETLAGEIASLTDKFATYRIEFTYTGKTPTEKDITAVELELQFGWDENFTGSCSLTNKVYVKSFGLYEAVEVSSTKDELVMDLTPTAVPSGEGGIHSIENATVVVNEGVAEILPSTFENGGWASFNKLKYTLTGKFEVGHKYALIIEAKADQARDIKVNLGGNYWPNNETLAGEIASLTDKFATYRIEFTYTGKTPTEKDITAVELELQFGWDENFTGSCSLTNKVYVKSFGLYEVVEIIPTKDELVKDLTPTAVPSGEGGIHTIENATVVVNEGVAEILPSTFENGGWASFNKFKYTLTNDLEIGSKYVLIIEAKADQARDIKVNLGGNYWPNNETLAGEVVPLTDKFTTYRIEFIYTGKTPTEKDITAVELELQFGWDENFTGSCSLTNKVYVKSFGLYEVVEVSSTKDELVKELNPTAVPSGEGGIHTIENATVVVNEGVAEILPSTFENGGWASFNKLKYTLTSDLEVGSKYALIIEAKADQARDIKVNLGGNYWPNNEVLAAEVLSLTDKFVTYRIEFTYTGKTPTEKDITAVELELQFGWDENFTGSCSLTNKVYVKSFGLYEIMEVGKVKEVKYDALKNGNFYSTGTLPTPTVNQDGSITFTTAANAWYGLNTLSVPAECKYVVFTVSCSEATYTEFKVDADGNPYHANRSKVTIPTEKTTYVIDLEAIGCTDSTKLIKLCFTQYSKELDYTIYEAYFTNIEPEE